MDIIVLRRTITATVITLAMACLGCHQATKVTTSSRPSRAEIEAKNFQAEAHDPTDRIAVSDTQAYPDISGERSVNDRRPLWVVEGRVTSNLLYAHADQVVLKIRFVKNDDGSVLDTAEVTVQNIDPQDTKAFREVVSLLPPRKGQKFKFAVDVSSVDTSPAKNPYPFFK